MITKLDNPKTAGSKVYSNKGSAGQLKNYLISNPDKLDKDDLFFDKDRENISGDEMLSRIDNNVKGLSRDNHKFFSISVNPSHQELIWIDNDKDKLKTYIREMSNYAKSFKKDGISDKDLVWGAILHEKRYYSKKEEYVWKKKNEGQQIPFKEGDAKPGNQMHAHIIVSARNKGMTKTLNALTSKNTVSRNFGLKEFFRKNQDSFQNMFYYKNGVNLYVESQRKLVSEKCDHLERLGYGRAEVEKINRVGERMNFDFRYTASLNRVVQQGYKGNRVLDTEKFLEIGERKYNNEFPGGIQKDGFDREPVFEQVIRREPKEEWNAFFAVIQEIGITAAKMNKPSKKVEEKEEEKHRRKRGMGF